MSAALVGSASAALPGAVVAGAVTALSMAMLLPWLRRRVVDIPNVRSTHSVPTPRGGGLSVVLGVLTGAATALVWREPWEVTLLMVITALGILGLVDDVRGLGVGLRFGGQVVVALALSGEVLRPSDVESVIVALVVIVAVVGFINAFNFMDGINGISALNGLVACAWFAIVAHQRAQETVWSGALVLGAALAVFLPFNFPGARVFLGDVGSYAIGGVVAGLALLLWKSGAPLVVVLAPLAIYLADTGVALARRLAGGRSWKEAHREHVYQRLVDSGVPQGVVAPAVAGFSALCCLACYSLGEGSGTAAVVVVVVMVCGAYLASPTAVLTNRRKRMRSA